MILEAIEKKLLNRTSQWTETAGLALVGLIIGVIVALVQALFFAGLSWIQAQRIHWEFWPFLAMPLAGVLIVHLFLKASFRSSKGMQLIFDVCEGRVQELPVRMSVLVFIGTWISQIVGSSTGKEGAAVQIGASLSDFIGRRIPFIAHRKGLLMIVGVAAGFAGLFGTPFTAIFFALELLGFSKMKKEALTSILVASLTSSMVAKTLGVVAFSFQINSLLSVKLEMTDARLFLLGVIFALCGIIFSFSLTTVRQVMAKYISNPYARILIFSIPAAVGLYFILNQRYAGTGSSLIYLVFDGGSVYWYDWILKLSLTVLCSSIGFIGGEVTPLLSIGACLGAVCGPLLGLDPILCAALGFSAVFGAATNSWLAPIILGLEVFGFEWFTYFFIVCTISYLIAHPISIYPLPEKEQ